MCAEVAALIALLFSAVIATPMITVQMILCLFLVTNRELQALMRPIISCRALPMNTYTHRAQRQALTLLRTSLMAAQPSQFTETRSHQRPWTHSSDLYRPALS